MVPSVYKADCFIIKYRDLYDTFQSLWLINVSTSFEHMGLSVTHSHTVSEFICAWQYSQGIDIARS